MEGFMIGEDGVCALAWAGVIVGTEYVGLLLLVLVDLWSGLLKARRRGEECTSRGMRRSVGKAGSYLLTLFACTLVDAMLVVSAVYLRYGMGFSVPSFPVLSTLGALSMMLIEVKSVVENVQEREPYRRALHGVRDFLDDDDVKWLRERIFGEGTKKITRHHDE